jgi:probable rRNA maturation factor
MIMMEIHLNNNQTKVELPADLEAIVQEAVQKLMQQEQKTHPGELSITLVDDEDIREMNRIYRQQDRVTDVLSFPAEHILAALDPDAPRIWGDVVVSLERAAEQAAEYGHSLRRELTFLVLHGVLHLLGYDHGDSQAAEIMEAKGEQVLADMGIGRDA